MATKPVMVMCPLHHWQLVNAVKHFERKEGLRGATVARLTPDQKVACSNHVGVNHFLFEQATRMACALFDSIAAFSLRVRNLYSNNNSRAA